MQNGSHIIDLLKALMLWLNFNGILDQKFIEILLFVQKIVGSKTRE